MEIPIIGRKKIPQRVLIAIPTRGQVESVFAGKLNALTVFTVLTMQKVPGFELDVTFCPGTYIHEQRNDLVKEAKRIGSAAILWLDDDMVFPRDALLQLLHRNLPIVGANYPTRTVDPCVPTAITSVLDSVRCYSDGKRGTETVEACGFGVMLTYMHVFDAFPYPWFETPHYPGLGPIGEDIDFCRKARDKGFEVHVDHELSQQIEHVGKFRYTLQHAAEYRDRMLAQSKVA